jgi:hypothetical protein
VDSLRWGKSLKGLTYQLVNLNWLSLCIHRQGDCRHPVIEEIFKYLVSKVQTDKFDLTKVIRELCTIPPYIIRYALALVRCITIMRMEGSNGLDRSGTA